MMTIIMESLHYIRLESLKCSFKSREHAQKKEHGPYFEVSVFRVKNIRICLQINISSFLPIISTLIILSKNKLKKIHVQVTQYL